MHERGAAEQDGFGLDSCSRVQKDLKQTGKDRMRGSGSMPMHANEANPKPSSICRDQLRQCFGHYKSYETIELRVILN